MAIYTSYDIYAKLRSQGKFGESFTDVISRLLNLAEIGNRKINADET
jgi:predicted CopG family antitoxin